MGHDKEEVVSTSVEVPEKKHGLTVGWAAVFVVANIAGSVIFFFHIFL